jgi:hypothetical protein
VLYRDSDPQFNKKKRHIGNDFVAIVYNESGLPYTMGTVKVAYFVIPLLKGLSHEINFKIL